jgi:hypothetical protein
VLTHANSVALKDRPALAPDWDEVSSAPPKADFLTSLDQLPE